MTKSAIIESPDRIEKVRRTAALRKEITDRCIDYEDEILTRLISQYGADQLTESQLRGAIGEIAALRRLLSDMESELIREG